MKILAFAGQRQAGKSSAGNFVAGYVLQHKEIVNRFDIADDGKLIVPTLDDEGVERAGIFDFMNRNTEFLRYCSYNIFPHVRIFNFADTLKDLCHTMFNLPLELLYGSDEDKEQLSNTTYGDIKSLLPIQELKDRNQNKTFEEKLTIREVLKRVADCMRAFDKDCFVRATLNEILYQQSEYSIICDARYNNEFEKIRAAGGKIIKLGAEKHSSDHSSETEVKNAPKEYFDAYIDNSGMTVREKNEAILKQLKLWGWF